MHILQKTLIKRLVQQNGLSYSQLTEGYDSDDNISFHLNQLINSGMIRKRDDAYYLLPKGVNATIKFNKISLADQFFKIFFIGYVCKFNESYLLKPHRNADEVFYNLPSGKPDFGEPLDKALIRHFYEETDIKVASDRFTFDSLHMKTIRTESEDPIYDDAFGVYIIEVAANEKSEMKLKKGCEWFELEEIAELPNRWPEIDFCILRKEWKPYLVYDVVNNYVVRREDV